MSEPPEGIKILLASYGDQRLVDVTEQVKKQLTNGIINFTVSPGGLGIPNPSSEGIKNRLQVNVSLNGGQPTLFTKYDGDQLVINSPTVQKQDKKDSAANQIANIFFYTLAALLGSYLAMSFYKFGKGALGSWIVGLVGAISIISSTVTFGIAESSVTGAALMAFTIGIAFLQFGIVFVISIFFPDYIDFSYSKQVIEPVVQAVTDISQPQ
jgi:hypothetical protein